jgi:hypothetical protein
MTNIDPPVFSIKYHAKRLTKGEVICQVRVFLFRVECQLDDWPEKSQRETKSFDADDAVDMVNEGGLAEIIASFSGSYSRFIAFHKL